jgi:hypothetical protein
MDIDFPKDFDGWISKKKDTHYKISTPPLFKERDIWWVSVGVNVGFEEDGKNGNFVRPVLVIKKFNRELFLGIPMSTKLKDNKYYVPVTVKNETVSVMTSQLRVFSSKRIWNKLSELDEGDFFRVLEEVSKFFVLPFPPKREGRG